MEEKRCYLKDISYKERNLEETKTFKPEKLADVGTT